MATQSSSPPFYIASLHGHPNRSRLSFATGGGRCRVCWLSSPCVLSTLLRQSLVQLSRCIYTWLFADTGVDGEGAVVRRQVKDDTISLGFFIHGQLAWGVAKGKETDHKKKSLLLSPSSRREKLVLRSTCWSVWPGLSGLICLVWSVWSGCRSMTLDILEHGSHGRPVSGAADAGRWFGPLDVAFLEWPSRFLGQRGKTRRRGVCIFQARLDACGATAAFGFQLVYGTRQLMYGRARAVLYGNGTGSCKFR